MADWHIGVIGGSGLHEGLALDQAQSIPVLSPFGDRDARRAAMLDAVAGRVLRKRR